MKQPQRDALMPLARFRSCDFRRMGISGDAEDMVQEVLLRAWQGKRNCALDVDLRAFFANAFKSVANQWLKEAYTDAADREEFHYHARCAELPDKSEEIARATVEAVRAMLGDDTEALEVLESKLDEMPPRDACPKLGVNEKQYNTARNRIKRRTRHAAAVAADGFRCTNFSRRRRLKT